jgi:hypothetical protein
LDSPVAVIRADPEDDCESVWLGISTSLREFQTFVTKALALKVATATVK